MQPVGPAGELVKADRDTAALNLWGLCAWCILWLLCKQGKSGKSR